MRRPPLSHLLVSAAGGALGAVAWSRGLPPGIPAPTAAFLLPAAVTVTDALLRRLAVEYPVEDATAASALAIYDAIMLRFTVFIIAVHALVLAALLGLLRGQAWVAPLVPLMLGFAMISIGNLLPRTRPNLAIGIRTRHTLADRALWMRVHRSAGYLMVACGAVVVLSAVAVPRPVGPGMILVAGPAALVGTLCVVWSCARQARA